MVEDCRRPYPAETAAPRDNAISEHDQVGYRGPLVDPTKRPIEEARRPPPRGESQASPEGPWHIRAGEQAPEAIRSLGRYLYVTIFANVNMTVLGDLEAAQKRIKVPDTSDSEAESLPVFQRPAVVFVDAFAARYHLSEPFLRRLCHAAGREISRELLAELRPRHDAWLRDPKRELDETLDSVAGRRPWRERYEASLLTLERVVADGLQASYADHLDVMVVADQQSAELGVPFHHRRERPEPIPPC